ATTEIKLMFWTKALKIGLAAAVVAAAGGGAAIAVASATPAGEGSLRDAARAVHDSVWGTLHGPVAADKDKLQGEWKITSAKHDGKDSDHLVGAAVTFDGDKVSFHGQPGTFKLDPKQNPKQ